MSDRYDPQGYWGPKGGKMDERGQYAEQAKPFDPRRRVGEADVDMYQTGRPLARPEGNPNFVPPTRQRKGGTGTGARHPHGWRADRRIAGPRPAHLDPSMTPNVERTLPPLGVELRDLNEALDMQAQLLAELTARLAPICSPIAQGVEANGQPEPPRSSITEAIHQFRCRAMEHNEVIRNLLSCLEI